MPDALKVGLIVGREWSFPPAFIEEVNRRDEGVVAELVKIGAPRMDEPVDYAVIIDRISHEVPFYRTYLKHAALQGTTVVNNPFMWTADDKFFGASLAHEAGDRPPEDGGAPAQGVRARNRARREPPQHGLPAGLGGHRGLRGDALRPEGRPRGRVEGGLRLPLAGGAGAPLQRAPAGSR